jgi:hypothetical protein
MESNHPTGGLLRPAGFEVRVLVVRLGRFAGVSRRQGRVACGQICRVGDMAGDMISSRMQLRAAGAPRSRTLEVGRHGAPPRAEASLTGVAGTLSEDAR